MRTHSVATSFYGDHGSVAEILKGSNFDERVKAIIESGNPHPERRSDPLWLAGDAAYAALRDTPAAFIVQFAYAKEGRDSWRVQAIMNSPSASNHLWSSLQWSGGVGEAIIW